MLIIPERKVVVILTPRTGTRSLKNAVLKRYPAAFLLYRHMEADGVPQGYDRWPKVGVVRDPIERLWSLYKYLKRFGIDWCAEHDSTYTYNMRASVAAPFDHWLLHNELVFTSPYDSAGWGRFYPAYTCRHPMPENRKSQYHYLRPDLGTEIVPYPVVKRLWANLEIDDLRENSTDETPPPTLSKQAAAYVQRWFSWDFDACAVANGL